jgi:hypothetical protein
MCKDDPSCPGPDSDDPVVRQQWWDQRDAWLRETIRRCGWAVQAVFGNPRKRRPDFSYTVGLWGFGHPELLVIGLAAEVAGRVPNPHEILYVAQNVYSGPGLPTVPALQVCYPDAHGRYPWDAGYADTRWLQPPPGRFAA